MTCLWVESTNFPELKMAAVSKGNAIVKIQEKLVKAPRLLFLVNSHKSQYVLTVVRTVF